ncbi:MAG: hypothetical protein Ta2E_01480 [Mycoplasmoidaceae bacterium]|nr:MAG: hypothetical protein Ta2E_01480 [Mycoplasmoidaceae bacterium]
MEGRVSRTFECSFRDLYCEIVDYDCDKFRKKKEKGLLRWCFDEPAKTLNLTWNISFYFSSVYQVFLFLFFGIEMVEIETLIVEIFESIYELSELYGKSYQEIREEHLNMIQSIVNNLNIVFEVENNNFLFIFVSMIDDWWYLIQRSDHRKHHEDVNKIGRTNDFDRRINEYPIDRQISSDAPVDNDKRCERELIKEFKSEFDWRNDIGNEYFEGMREIWYRSFTITVDNIFLIEKRKLIRILSGKLKINDSHMSEIREDLNIEILFKYFIVYFWFWFYFFFSLNVEIFLLAMFHWNSKRKISEGYKINYLFRSLVSRWKNKV